MSGGVVCGERVMSDERPAVSACPCGVFRFRFRLASRRLGWLWVFLA